MLQLISMLHFCALCVHFEPNPAPLLLLWVLVNLAPTFCARWDQCNSELGACWQDKFARRHSESASTRRISAEGSPRSRQIRTAPQRERFDTHDPRRGFIGLKTNSHGATARALRHARSPQRVRRAQDKFARRHSESASTRTISAEGCVS